MPIKKRSKLPPKPKPRKKVDIDNVELHPSLQRLDELAKEHDRLSSDYYWKGDDVMGKHHQDIANRFRERLAEGELYEPKH